MNKKFRGMFVPYFNTFLTKNMKKIVLSLGLLLGIAGVAQAQETRFGAKIGLGLATITGSDIKEVKNLVVFNGGVMADISFSDLISFHPELLYSQRGAKSDGTYTGVTYTGTTRLGYIDVPLLLRIKASGLFFEAGPQLGILLSQNTEATVAYSGRSTTSSSSSTEGLRKLDFGYVVGVGFQLPEGLELGIRYNGGLLDLNDPSDSPKQYNSVFQFQVGYLFGGK